MSIKTTELIFLNEASKALKQKNFIILQDISCICDYDNFGGYLNFVRIPMQNFYVPEVHNYIVNARELSAFIKTIMLESEFEFEDYGFYKIIRTMNGELRFNALFTNRINTSILPNTINILSERFPLIPETEITSELVNVIALNSKDGSIGFIYKNFYMTLFSGIISASKSDKIFITIFPCDNFSFIANFKVKKKKFDQEIIIRYLYL